MEQFVSTTDLTEKLKILQRCADNCESTEAKLARELSTAYQTSVQSRSQNMLTLMAPTINEAAQLYESNVASQVNLKGLVSLYRSALRMEETLELPAGRPRGSVDDLIDRIVDLPQRFPNEAGAYAVLGKYYAMTDAKPEATIQAYKVCASLDKEHEECTTGYAQLVQSFTRPRCETINIKGDLAFYLASSVPAQGFTLVKKNGTEKIYLEAQPRFSKADVAEVANKLNEPGGEAIAIKLNRGERAEFTELTRLNQGKNLALVYDGEVLAAPTIASEIKQAEAIVPSPEGKSLFSKICPQPTTAELPDHLRL